MKEQMPGPTGEFPEGRLNEHDEGELMIGLVAHKGKVVLNFATPVAWLALNPNQAIQIANVLIEKAKALQS